MVVPASGSADTIQRSRSIHRRPSGYTSWDLRRSPAQETCNPHGDVRRAGVMGGSVVGAAEDSRGYRDWRSSCSVQVRSRNPERSVAGADLRWSRHSAARVCARMEATPLSIRDCRQNGVDELRNAGRAYFMACVRIRTRAADTSLLRSARNADRVYDAGSIEQALVFAPPLRPARVGVAVADLWRVAANNQVIPRHTPAGEAARGKEVRELPPLKSGQAPTCKRNLWLKLGVSVFPELNERLVMTFRTIDITPGFVKLAEPEMRTREPVIIRPCERRRSGDVSSVCGDCRILHVRSVEGAGQHLVGTAGA